MHRDRAVGAAHLLGKSHGTARRGAPSEDLPTPQYFSRHHYDIAMLLDTEGGKAAAAGFELLAQVAKHKAVFYRSGWASYDTARPGTLQLDAFGGAARRICAPTIATWRR